MIQDAQIKRIAEEKLSHLEAQDDIEQFFVERGVCGRAQDGRGCPVASYLKDCLLREADQDVDVLISQSVWLDNGVGLHMDDNVEAFIEKFDRGDCPDELYR